jgi:hypothetical protein
MRIDAVARALALLTAPVVVATSGCLFVASADDAELFDEFAAFKAQGGQCSAGPAPDVGDQPLADVTRYRWFAYAGLLSEVVSPTGNVRYPQLNDDIELLDASRTTVAHMAQVDPAALDGRDEKLAHWINVYNALVLDAAARAFAEDPLFSVDENSFGFFDQEVFNVGGRTWSLNQIENGVLRGDEFHPAIFPLDEEDKSILFELHDQLWAGGPVDPRFHFVINCASSSCPSLLSQPLRADSLDSVLDDATHAFLHDDGRGAGPDGISQIFNFYYADWENEAGTGVEDFIAQYRDLDEVDPFRFLPYDWSLNLATD